MANGGSTTSGSGLAAVNSVVVLMLENRSFDHMLGFLYPGNVSPSGQPFDGLTGTESNPGSSGQPVTVFGIEPTTPSAYFMPGADPGEGYMAANDQLYGSTSGPASSGQAATCQGFVANYAYTLGWQSKESGWPIVPGTVEGDIMGCFTPQALSALAAAATVSHLEEISAELISRQYPAGTPEGAVAPPPRLTRPPASS
jgi:phospholipase C